MSLQNVCCYKLGSVALKFASPQMACRYNVCVLLKVVLVVLQCLCLYKVFPATKFLLLQSLCRCKVCVAAKFLSLQSLRRLNGCFSVQCLCRYKVFPATKFVSLQSLIRYKVWVATKFVTLQRFWCYIICVATSNICGATNLVTQDTTCISIFQLCVYMSD